MRYIWSRLIILILVFEGIVFVINYNFGAFGLRTLHNLKDTKKILHHDIKQLQDDNNALQDQIHEWSDSLFLQEKYAREKLQMKKDNELIYFR